MIEMVELVRENITKDEILPAVSLVVTVGFIMIGGYVMSYLVKMEEESVQRQLGAKGLKVFVPMSKNNYPSSTLRRYFFYHIRFVMPTIMAKSRF